MKRKISNLVRNMTETIRKMPVYVPVRLLNSMYNVSKNIKPPETRLRIIIGENKIYHKYVSVNDTGKYPVEGTNYTNAAFFVEGVSNEIGFQNPQFNEIDLSKPLNESVENKPAERGRMRLSGIDVYSTDYIETMIQQKTFKDMMYTREDNRMIDKEQMQYIILAVLGLTVSLMAYQLIA